MNSTDAERLEMQVRDMQDMRRTAEEGAQLVEVGIGVCLVRELVLQRMLFSSSSVPSNANAKAKQNKTSLNSHVRFEREAALDQEHEKYQATNKSNPWHRYPRHVWTVLHKH